MSIPIIISGCFPPTSDCHFVSVYEHRDGRKVEIHSGHMLESEKQKAMLQERGNVSGTLGSILYHEAFPDDQVCANCVGQVSHGKMKDGKLVINMASSSPSFRSHWGKLCPSCRQQKVELLQRDFEQSLLRFGLKASITIEPIENTNHG